MNASDRIGSEWRLYRTRAIHIDASAIQARECRRAFYAGATMLLAICLDVIGNEETTEEEQMQVLDGIARELQQFARDVHANRA